MTPPWTAALIVVAGLVGAAIAGAIALSIARRKRAAALQSVRDVRGEERRAATYLEVAVGWHGYLQTLRPLIFPEDGVSPKRPRDLAAVLRSRAQLELFGTRLVQQLHDEALEEAVTLINVLRSTPKSPSTGAPDISAQRHVLGFVLGEIGKKVEVLESQMSRELQSGTTLPEQSVELAGRRLGTGHAVTNGRHNAEVGDEVGQLRR